MLLSSVIQRGTRGSQPAASAVANGTIYCVTDENNILERSTGSAWQSYGPIERYVVAAGDESDSDNTLHSDAELLFSVAASAVYHVDILLILASGASSTPDFKVTFTLPASATMTLFGVGPDAAATAATGVRVNGVYQGASAFTALAFGVIASLTYGVQLSGIIRTVGAGTAQLQWAQNTTDATATVRKADSYIRYTRVS